MTFQGDPFRTLGVAPGASVNEIKSAYRRLAKQFHPDTAGERALPRFLAIKAAYEALVDDQGLLRTSSGGTARPGAWTADPDRARATRDAYRARRAGAAPAGSARATPGSTAGRAGRRGATAGSGATSAGGTGDRDARRRGPRKATPGSTTYDEAREDPFDPEWQGAGWYGTSLGTYWTINPREYADPRKHGPEYAARARRAATEEAVGPAGGPGDEAAGGPGDEAAGRPGDEAAGEPGIQAAGGPRDGAGDEASGPPGDGAAAHATTTNPTAPTGHEASDTARGAPQPETGARATAPRTDAAGAGTSWRWSAGRMRDAGETGSGAADWSAASWRYGDAPGRTPERDMANPAGRARAAPATERQAAGLDLEAIVAEAGPRRLRTRAQRSPAGRVVVALVAWPPLGFVAATVIDALTGCGDLAASCAQPESLLPIVVQPFLLVLLGLLPVLAATAAFASLAALAVVVPTTFVLSASGVDEGDSTARSLVSVVAPVAYLLGWGLGLALLRRPDATAATTS